MKDRYLSPQLKELCFSRHKMALVSGPRQCGKTTLAKILLKERKAGQYHNWDDIGFRRIWTKDPGGIIPKVRLPVPLVILDEIHKVRNWKRTLKGIYDTLESPADILVTGSARLTVCRKGGDSLLGRYIPFRLHPFSLREMNTINSIPPQDVIDSIFDRTLKPRKRTNFELLMKFGPFPEPLLGQNQRMARIWRQNRVETIIREDLRDLSRIPELSRIEMMASLLPAKIGSPFSITSIREDLEVGYETVKRWLTLLKELYYLYELKPYQRRIARSLKKEGKIYLWDPSEVHAPAPRFENLVAGHLLKACHFWTDTGEGRFELFYLRNKEKQEIDFLITRDGEAWLPVEVKLSDTDPSPNWGAFMKKLPCKRGLQLVWKPGYWKKHNQDHGEILVACASEVLYYFV